MVQKAIPLFHLDAHNSPYWDRKYQNGRQNNVLLSELYGNVSPPLEKYSAGTREIIDEQRL